MAPRDEQVRARRPRPRKGGGSGGVRIGAILAIVAIVAFGGWLALRGKSSNTTTTTSTAASTSSAPVGPVAVSPAGLATIASGLNQPIYWAGAQRHVTYELTRSATGRVFVRYLPDGVAVGSSTPYLTVATYPVSNAFTQTSEVAAGANSMRVAAPGGAIAFYGKSDPSSVYEAFPGSNFQIEIYSPSPAQARKLVRTGRIRPVGGSSGASFSAIGPVSASVAMLRATSKPGHTIYWAGPRRGTTYELTQLANGRVYVRYLPSGVKVGVNKPYLTVCTFPIPGAYAATLAASNRSGAVKIPFKGGIAFYSASLPTSVFIAYRGSNEQIEVYDPAPDEAHSLVAGGKVHALP